jgi:DNA-binding SARP family transcriptional activator
MTVEFRLLGEIDARVDGQRVDIGHTRQRCVLAALLVEVNRPVPADQLISRVWADRPPHRARNALSAYLSRLRQQLGGAPGVRITRLPGGYELSVDPLAVDLHRFRHLVGQARAADQPAAATSRYGQALRMWRGEPFGAVDTPWFDSVRTSLQAERLAVELDRNDAALRAGRHGDLLVEIAAAVRAQPRSCSRSEASSPPIAGSI